MRLIDTLVTVHSQVWAGYKSSIIDLPAFDHSI